MVILGAVYTKPIELGYKVLGHDRANRIAESFTLRTVLTGHIQVMEIEAFAVAAMKPILWSKSRTSNATACDMEILLAMLLLWGFTCGTIYIFS